MYGNSVSVRDAAELYKASKAVWRNVTETHVYGWYIQWAKCVPSTLFYYDMKKCVMWLGRDERVEPKVNSEELWTGDI